MRARNARWFSMSDDREAVPVSDGASTAVALATAGMTFDKPDELTWWDWTVFLLHTAAEIEHSLLVQYLYAAYSLADRDFTGPAVPPEASTLTATWRETILGIAREEMAHLLTVCNLLRFVGGPLNLEREDFPFRALLYPFPLMLEPLTKTSLAKYVAAEMPAAPARPPELIQEIVDRATTATGGLPINRVGVMYDTLIGIFDDPAKLAESDLRPQTAGVLQAAPADWFAFDPLIVRAVGSRAQAVDALRAIGQQGEGSMSSPPEDPSHFDHFIEIYQAFPETDASVAPITWVPTRSIPRHPNTLPGPSTDAALERGRITDPMTRLWAHLFNVRYRMLLVDLAHALHLSGPMREGGRPTLRGHLRTWTFGEMLTGVRQIAITLTTLPLKQAPSSADPAHAGPPFELPYTLALPDNERDRWRLHLALLDTSRELIDKIVEASETNDVLEALRAIDQAARAVVEAQLLP